jgi:glyoxylase-like metal-dependent hydrolase (beta-lactamase superfamily II)|tara:strand:+ start:1209 stop:2147 length:939 start_codon:yes stop_codon:yes gene_type:complete
MKYFILIILFSSFSIAQTNDKDLEAFRKVEKDVENNLTEEIVKINDTFFMIKPIGGVAGNIGVFISDKGLVLVDDQWEIIEDLILETIKSISKKEVSFIINTHFHYDHVDGNKAFGKKGIPIVSHENVRKRLKRKTKLYGHPQHNYNMVQDKYPDYALPSTVYNSTMKIYIDDEEIQLSNFGPGHTDGDTIVFFKKNNVIHAGDSFVTYGYPFVDLNDGGSFKGFINILSQIIAISNGQTKIIPGHGPVCDINDVITLKNILQEHYEITEKGFTEGLSVEQIMAEIKSELNGPGNITKKDFIKNIIYDLKTN